VIYDGIEGIVVGDYENMKSLLSELSEEVRDLL